MPKVKQQWFIDGKEVSKSYIRILAVKKGILKDGRYLKYNFATIPFNRCTLFLMEQMVDLNVKHTIHS